MDDYRIVLPRNVKIIISNLEKRGFEAFAVGGCVRDVLLGRTPKDWDITTNATPEQVKGIFRRTVDTGIIHGTVTVLIGGETYEVTTYRIDGKYGDSRHPDSVSYTGELKEDLKRRDFTVNALAYNEKRGLIDEFDGISDMKNRVIRAVGDPMERFDEDALRIMRAARFGAELDFDIEKETLEAMGKMPERLRNISAERVRDELLKLLVSKHPERLLTLYDTGITRVIMPEFDTLIATPQHNEHHMYNVGIHTIEALKFSTTFDDSISGQERAVLRLTMLLHDMGKPACHTVDEDGIDHFKGHSEVSVDIAADFFRRLKFDNNTRDTVLKLVKYHDHRHDITKPKVRKTMAAIGRELMPLWFMVRRCDTMAQSLYIREKKLEEIDRYERTCHEIEEAGDPLTIKELKINGNDLIKTGIKPGKGMGAILESLLLEVMAEPSHNEKEWLLLRAKELEAGMK